MGRQTGRRPVFDTQDRVKDSRHGGGCTRDGGTGRRSWDWQLARGGNEGGGAWVRRFTDAQNGRRRMTLGLEQISGSRGLVGAGWRRLLSGSEVQVCWLRTGSCLGVSSSAKHLGTYVVGR